LEFIATQSVIILIFTLDLFTTHDRPSVQCAPVHVISAYSHRYVCALNTEQSAFRSVIWQLSSTAD